MVGPNDPKHLPPESAAAVLAKNADKILDIWLKRIRERIAAAKQEQHPVLVDTLPAFIQNLVQALAVNFPRTLATEGTTVALEHGGERARIGNFRPTDIILEYQILRDTILEVLGEHIQPTAEERSIVLKSIDLALTEAVGAFFSVYQELREQFTATLTHDLRTPLSAIKAAADMALRYPDKHAGPDMLNRISKNSVRMDRMIQELLDASQLHIGECLHFAVQKMEISELLREIISNLSTTHGSRFVIDGEETVQGYWNRDYLRRAVENLLSNAVKYGCATRPITLKYRMNHERIFISVHNEGSLLSTKDQKAVFQPYKRTKDAQRGANQGWGLGLALVRGVAEGHGGSVTVDSSLERGTSFLVDIPVDGRPFVKNE